MYSVGMTQPQLIENDGLAARATALLLLEGVLHRKKPLDDVLKNDQTFLSLSERDRAFTRMLIATTLRRLGQIDAMIVKAMDKGDVPRPHSLHDIIRLGCTQIFFMDVADHAAVDTSVTLAEKSQKGFVNAVLRRMTGEGREWIKHQKESQNIPDWIFEQWERDYGSDIAADIAKASLSEAPLDITVKIEKEIDIWAGTLESTKLPSGTVRRPSGGRVELLPGFDVGAWWVQDASSALPVKLLGDVQGKNVIDLCAAPGGKTMQLAARGAQVTAVDRSAARMKVLQENLKRMKLESNVQSVIADGSLWKPAHPVPYVLVDAPCTATGTLRRHPDVIHLKARSDQDGLMDIQARLLANAADCVEAGGTLMYCTCSLQKEEGEEQVLHFLEYRPEFTIDPINSGELGGAKDIIDSYGFARILPFHWAARGGMDGFFIARLKKS